MPLPKRKTVIRAAALYLALVSGTAATAQDRMPCKNQYPCGDCAVHDNNGNDLAGFVKNYTKQLQNSGGVVIKASGDKWGYMLLRTVSVPSVSSKWATEGNLNYSFYIRTTLAMVKSEEQSVATWWARECDRENGPMVQTKTKASGNKEVGLPLERYGNVFDGLLEKNITLVEYLDTFNMRDMNYLIKKNHIVTKCGAIQQEDYKGLVAYFNTFFSKFSYTDDPVLSKMAFITFFTGESGSRYIAHFNYENDKLSGWLKPLNLQYERDKDSAVARTFRELKARTVYIYGDDSYGMDKTIIQYAKDNDYKLRRRNTNVTTKFNDER